MFMEAMGPLSEAVSIMSLLCTLRKKPSFSRTGFLVAAAWCGMALLAPLGQAQESGAAVSTSGDSSTQGLAVHLHRLQELVQACKQSRKSCAADVGSDDTVTDGAAGGYTVRWNWLRDALHDAGGASDEQRSDAMDKSAARLDELAVETGGASNAPEASRSDAEFSRVRKKTAEVLATPEFNRRAKEPSWWDRMRARLNRFLFTIFGGAAELGRKAPWLGTFVEWSLFLGAAVLLLLMVKRIFARQRMQVALVGAAQLGAWSREAQDWAAEAERWAQLGEWREAVHCLYWAAIVRLEARRAWRHNPSRTPREYVRLLKPGSAQQTALRALTGIFERVWYGLRDAQAADYQRARTLFDGLGDSPREQAAPEPAV